MSQFVTFFLKNLGIVVAGSYAESKYVPKNTDGPAGLSTYFALTPLIFSLFNFVILTQGFQAGQARRKYMEQAKKDGEENVEERYDLPNLYAQGTSKNARAFNCVQRAHQHIFEGLTQTVVSGLIGAISYPVTAAVGSMIYVVGRYYASKGYAEGEGDASKRYSYSLARYMWQGMLMNMFLAILASTKMLTGGNKSIIW